MADYPRIDVTVDVVAFVEVNGLLRVLVVRRGNAPFEGWWALPGGYHEVEESLASGALRALEEETGLAVAADRLRQIGAYGDPDRDPRNRTVSVAFSFELDAQCGVRGGSDATEALWQPVEDVLRDGLAFDHDTILRDAVGMRRAESARKVR